MISDPIDSASSDMNQFEFAQKVANAVLYEGYALYPYRASAAKNRIRFQWGVLVPPAYAEHDPSERSAMQAEFLAERADNTRFRLRLRFLHLSERNLEISSEGKWIQVDELDLGDELLQVWDEAGEQQFDLEVTIADVLETPFRQDLSWGAEESVEDVITAVGMPGRILRRRWPISGRIEIVAARLAGPHNVVKLSVRITNTTGDDSQTRDVALRRSLIGCHFLASISDRGRFISSMAPPEWAGWYLDECENIGSFPVLAESDGEDQVILASPIILYDHPTIAPESPGDLFDALEIDEILTLRTMTLTEDEKRRARGTDPRTAAIIDHVDFLPPEMLDRLHGAIRSVYPVARGRPVSEAPSWFDTHLAGDPPLPLQLAGDPPLPHDPTGVPWWDPGGDRSVSPMTDTVNIDGAVVSRGSRVRLRPVLQRSDAQDMFLTGRVALVEAVLLDVDDNVHLAVTLEDDPGADLMAAEGRYRYFSPDEVVPMRDAVPMNSGEPGAVPPLKGERP